ncbi:TIGR04222 domain-containing membrane protein [Streptomyces antibioticus]|uniref:TIGR04222 domain-containing membrane protein n=1 Tax=Streptomyces antibioticus TaxID=1890 RepID=UPI003401EBEE
MSGDGSVGIGPYEVALLRGGPRAAVTTAVVELYLRGVVEAGRPGRLRTSGSSPEKAGPASSPLPPLAAAVRVALHRPAGLPELLADPGVGQALTELVREVRSAGLLRTLPPHRGRAARTALRALRATHPLPAGRGEVPEGDMTLVVALYGEEALRLLVPRFALRAGLLPRVEVTDKPFHRRAPRGNGSSGGSGFSCGGAASCGGSY